MKILHILGYIINILAYMCLGYVVINYINWRIKQHRKQKEFEKLVIGGRAYISRSFRKDK